MQILVADIGGTNARFAVASVSDDHIELSHISSMRVADFDSFSAALKSYKANFPAALPGHAVLSVAAQVEDGNASLTNANWQFESAGIAKLFGFQTVTLINDFVAIGHAVAMQKGNAFEHCLGPTETNISSSPILVVGPGTGLGAAIIMEAGTDYEVIETEGGHIGFSPSNKFQHALLERMQKTYGRVSVERVAAGPALCDIYACASNASDGSKEELSDAELWEYVLEQRDEASRIALEQYCDILGGAAGDLALASGAKTMVLVGSIANRLKPLLSGDSFADGLYRKGRFEGRMRHISVELLSDIQAGLYGAATYYFKKQQP